MKKLEEELKLARLNYEAVITERYKLEDQKNSLVKLLAETMQRSKLLAAHLRK